jgi:hypothetical protein
MITPSISFGVIVAECSGHVKEHCQHYKATEQADVNNSFEIDKYIKILNNFNGSIIKLVITPWPDPASELYRPRDLRMSTKLVPTLEDRGCHVVSVTDPIIKLAIYEYLYVRKYKIKFENETNGRR